MLRVSGLNVTLQSFRLHDLDLELEAGKYFVLLGPSGAGKSVLVETIAGLVTQRTGTIGLSGRDISSERIQKRGVGMVFQKPELFPHMNVRANISYALNRKRASRREISERVDQLALEVGVSHLMDRYPETLSGGEAQRVALARVMAYQPDCLLLDEPLASLDVHSRVEMRRLLRKLNRSGMTMLHVTHDFEEAVSLADKIGIIDKGCIIQIGTVEEVLRHPASEFVARFIGFRNVWKGRIEQVSPEGSNLATFHCGNTGFSVLLLEEQNLLPSGTEGVLYLRSQDVIISRKKPETSARNSFPGTIVDLAPSRHGIELTVDIGVEVFSVITEESVKTMELDQAGQVWISFKATAGRFCAR